MWAMTVSESEPAGPALPIYLGSALPRWQPSSIADVQAAIDDGTLREGHWLDAKREIGSTDSKKRETACDLASFANDGGALLIGVAEDKPAQTLSLEPVALDGLAEQLDSIARSRCDPPLHIVCHPLAGPRDAQGRATGVLLVQIPPSPSAPHMVDGRYYGRGDTTKHRLTDGDVTRLHAVRSARQLTARQLIAAEIARDPMPQDTRSRGHLYVVAHPLASPPDLLTHLIGTNELADKVAYVGAHVPGAQQFEPQWEYARRREPRGKGMGFTSHGLLGRRYMNGLDGAEEKYLLDVEIHDDGTVTLFSGRGTDVYRREGENIPVVVDIGAVVLTRSVATVAGELGAKTGYAGQWMLAIGITETAGTYTSSIIGRFGDHAPYSEDSYIQGTEAGTAELLTQPGAVTTRLVGRLLRGLGTSRPELLADSAQATGA